MIFSSLEQERETHVLGLMRVAFALLLFFLTLKAAEPLTRGVYFGDVFHMPVLPESWVPTRALYTTLLGLQGACCLLALAGLWARPALFLAAMLALYGLLCDRLEYHNNRYELVLLSALVALTPCARSFRLVGAPRLGAGPRWAVWAVGAQVSLPYLASSLGKLLDPDWRGGAVLLRRFAMAIPYAEHYVSESAGSIFRSAGFAHAAALAAIATELFLALGLWGRRTRPLALWLGTMFHVGIELIAHVELFSYTMLAGYLAFVTPELRRRSLTWSTRSFSGRCAAAVCRRLDLLARFEHRTDPEQPTLLRVTDAQGHRHEHLPAWRELARAFPPLFPLWLPLALVSLRQGKLPPQPAGA